MADHYPVAMTSTQQNPSHESINSLYADMVKHMYFGSLIYWGNLLLQGQKTMIARLTSLESDMQRAQVDTGWHKKN